MRRLGRGYGRKPFTIEDWGKSWLLRGPQQPTSEQILRRNEIEHFRLVLARKEPKA